MTISHWNMQSTTLEPAEDAKETIKTKKKPGRKTNAERLELQAERMRRERIAQVESKRAPRIQPDTSLTLAITLIIAAIVLITSFTISYATMVSVATWMALPMPWLAYAVPGFIELLTVFASLDFIVSRSRGKSGYASLVAMAVFTAVAVIGNVSHTLSGWSGHFSWQAWIGVVLSGAAPLVILLVTKRVSALVFAEVENADG